MKVLLLNGSPKASGNTALALDEMVKVFQEEGIETQVVQVGPAQQIFHYQRNASCIQPVLEQCARWNARPS